MYVSISPRRPERAQRQNNKRHHEQRSRTEGVSKLRDIMVTLQCNEVAGESHAHQSGCIHHPRRRRRGCDVADNGDKPMTSPVSARTSWTGWRSTFRFTAPSLGDHRYDAVLDDVSAAGRAQQRAFAAALLTRLEAIDLAALPEAERIDTEMLRHELTYTLWRIDELAEWAWNPMYYTGLAGDSLYTLMARDFAPVSERLAAANSEAGGAASAVCRGPCRTRSGARSSGACRDGAGAAARHRVDLSMR